jgi:hypothetical protein
LSGQWHRRIQTVRSLTPSQVREIRRQACLYVGLKPFAVARLVKTQLHLRASMRAIYDVIRRDSYVEL